MRSKGAYGLALPSQVMKDSLSAIDAYLAAPSAATLAQVQDALSTAVKAVESDFNSSLKKDYLKSPRFGRDRNAYKDFITRPRSGGGVGRRRSPAIGGGSPVGRARPVFNPLALGGAEIVENLVDAIDDVGWQTIQTEVEKRIESEVRTLLESQADLSKFSVEGVAEELSSQRNTPLEEALRQTLFDTIYAVAASYPDIQAQLETLTGNYSDPEVSRLFDRTVINDQYRSLLEKAEGSGSYLELAIQKTALEIKQHWVTQQNDLTLDSLDADMQLFVGQTQDEISHQTTELASLESLLKTKSEDSVEHSDVKRQIEEVSRTIERKRGEIEATEKCREDLTKDAYSERREMTERKLTERRGEVFARR
jgi:hypothetical protein